MPPDLPYSSADAVERRSIHGGDSLAVWAARFPDGSIRIEGQDLRSPFGGEYEYLIIVEPEHLELLRAALGVDAEADLIEALAEQAPEIVRRGERSWLTERGVTTGFSSYRSFD